MTGRQDAEREGAPVTGGHAAGMPAGPQRVRFSPAPTGGLHVGGARTALFNWLVARHTGGAFILRIEDTDLERCGGPECEAALVEDLAWLGLDWDEGPEIGGPHAPYRQSERDKMGCYAEAVEKLVAEESVYACFCTDEQLAAQRAADGDTGEQPRYRGPCCDLPGEESRRRLEAGEPAAWRFRVRPGPPVAFVDVVHGPMSFDRGVIGDFIVARSEGSPMYDLAAAVDDAEMYVSLVIRGDDHLSNTPRQILLAEALGVPAPSYAHLPLVRGGDGRPLSKRRGAPTIAELREQGYLPEALINHAALLGWSHPEHEEILSRESLVAGFDLLRVGRAPAMHDPARLDWMNERHIRELSPERLEREVRRVLPRELPAWFATGTFAGGVRGEITTLQDAASLAAPLLDPAAPGEDARDKMAAPAGRIAVAIAAAAIDAGLRDGGAIATALKSDLADAGVAPRDGLPAVRAALTGSAHGLPLALILAVIGTAESRARLGAATM